jgi:HAMP domain-containing protein
MAAIARRVIRDMIATTTVATTPTAGAMVIAATPAAAVTVVTVRAAMVGAAAMMAMAATARPTVDGPAHPLEGEFLRSAKLVNTMIEQLAIFTSEVTRVAHEVGTEGKLGGQAQVKSVSGVWKELTDSVNQMAGNLTAQVRNIAEVTIAVANGDLSKKITVDVRGEILQLKEVINTMVDQLRSFASEVARIPVWANLRPAVWHCARAALQRQAGAPRACLTVPLHE